MAQRAPAPPAPLPSRASGLEGLQARVRALLPSAARPVTRDKSLSSPLRGEGERRARRFRRGPSGAPHHRPGGGFCNPWPSAGGSIGGGDGSVVPRLERETGAPAPEVLASMLLLSARPEFGKNGHWAHWLGHGTFVIELDGMTVLTDPVWAGRLGPLGARRLVPMPCGVADLPEIDVVLLSGGGYNHFDKRAVEELGGNVRRWVVPLGVKSMVVECGVREERVTELDWWQECAVPLRGAEGEVRFACTPSQSSSPRGDTLWCSFYITHPARRLYFCGGGGYRAVDVKDSSVGYSERVALAAPTCPAFRDVLQRYGPCDVAFLPIGGASPRSEMAAHNLDAVDMLLAQQDLRSRKVVAHRWGTFQAGGEGMLDPPRALESALLESGVSEQAVSYMRHGQAHRC